MFQAVLMWIISLAYVYGNVASGIAIPWLFAVGVVVWIFGFAFEAIGDKH